MFNKQVKSAKENESIEFRLFRIVAGGGAIASVAGAVSSIVTGLSWTLVIATLFGGFFVYFLMKIVEKYGKTELCSSILLIFFNCFLLPFAFFSGGGIKSGINAWYVLGIFCVFLLIRGKMFWPMLIISIMGMVVTYSVAYLYPELVNPFENEFMAHQDIVLSILIVTIIIGCIVKFQNRIFEEERKRVVEQNMELERLSKTRNRFYANMSHEIRTPINTIIGLNEMILRDDISDEIAENSMHIQEASKMLLALINDVLDLSKIESGKMEIVPVQYETGKLFSELVNIIWIRAHEKKLEFKLDISPEIPSMLYGDVVRIKQVITNLLTNAVKYTSKGFVILSAKSEVTGNNKVLLTISVKDSGIGIKKEDMNRLFHSFQRVDEVSNVGIEGTGLGLSISSQLIEMMGGTITVDSIYQKGSTFTIQIEQDIMSSNPMGHMEFMTKDTSNRRKKYKKTFEAPDARILIVDDNEMNLMVTKKLLRATKIQIDTAKSGNECLNMTKRKFYHVIFMDHMMPEMDGVETLSKLRKQENGLCRKTPVIALTANAMENAEEVYQNYGFHGYLAKPITGSLIEAVLLQYLPKDLVEYASVSGEDEEENIRLKQTRAAVRKKIHITTDCVCDLPIEYTEYFGIEIIHFYVNTEMGRFCDGKEINSDNLLEYMESVAGNVKSFCAPIEEYETFFSNALTVGEQVIHISIAKEVSDGYKNACAAAQGFDHVSVVDSGHLSSGMGIMVLSAALMVKNGCSVDEILSKMERMKQMVNTSFITSSAERLFQNGRINRYVKKVCDLFDLHIILSMKKSRIVLRGVQSGNIKHSYMEYIKRCLKGKKNIDTRVLFITYSGCTSRQLKEFREEVEKYQKFDKIVYQKASATISGNCGVGALGLFYLKKGKDD